MRYDLSNTRQGTLSPSSGTTSLRPVIAVGPKGADGSNVLPTDTAIKEAIENPESETATALTASIDEKVAPDLNDRDTAIGTALVAAIAGAMADPDHKVLSVLTNSTLSAPSWWAHRGGAWAGPEETIQATRAALAGVSVGWDIDTQVLADGSVVPMHDTNTLRTMGVSRAVSSLTFPEFQAMDAAATWPNASRRVEPCSVSQFLNEFGGHNPGFIELKDAGARDDMMDYVHARGLNEYVCFVGDVDDYAWLVTIAQDPRGFVTRMRYNSGDTATRNPVTAAAAGISIFAVDGSTSNSGATQTMSDAEINTIKAAGVPVIAYHMNRRVDRDRMLGLGIYNFLADDPEYVSRDTPIHSTYPWASGLLGYGVVPHDSSASLVIEPRDRYTVGSSRLRLISTSTARPGCLLGGQCPIAGMNGTTVTGTKTWTFEAGVETIPADSTASLRIVLGAVDDTRYGGTSGASSIECWVFYINLVSGQLQLRREKAALAASTTVATQATAALVAGAASTYTITMTTSTITFQRTGYTAISYATSGSGADGTLRGGYMSVAKVSCGDAVPFITPPVIT